ncbi:hypothetical protein [Alteribacter aurantiacus]|uniref:hypothetical protein n=1 Tax=Alteribacter aurantiacus TaxID=254410 RepID=UPI0004258BEE|nr:hypothetical protein [Alteribacter aurantiacus]
MEQILFGSWAIEVDVRKTKEFYDQYHLITDDCNCDYCSNYVLACSTFSSELNALFHSLGIDPRKEGEVSEYTKNQDGTHLYGVFYHVRGKIVDGPTDWQPIKMNGQPVCEIRLSNELDLVPVRFPKPAIQLEVQMNVPWLLR